MEVVNRQSRTPLLYLILLFNWGKIVLPSVSREIISVIFFFFKEKNCFPTFVVKKNGVLFFKKKICFFPTISEANRHFKIIRLKKCSIKLGFRIFNKQY